MRFPIPDKYYFAINMIRKREKIKFRASKFQEEGLNFNKKLFWPSSLLFSTLFFFLIFWIGFPSSAWTSELVWHSPEIRYQEIGGFRLGFDKKAFGSTLPPDISGFLIKNIRLIWTPTIYSIPGHKKFFLISGLGPLSKKDYGRRLALFKKEGGPFKLVFEGRGFGDTYYLDLYFYLGENILIFADAGDESGCWGLWAYEFNTQTETFKSIGRLNVARKNENPNVDSLSNPLDKARVFLTEKGYRVDFYTDLVFDPGGVKEKFIKRSGDKLVFIHNGKMFVLKTKMK